MKVEVLTAQKEHIYWSGIPEKARLAAYEKYKSSTGKGIKSTTNTEPLVKRRRIQHDDDTHTASDILFPRNRVVFAKNIHPETNKTALRKLFGVAFNNDQMDNSDGDPLEYVDYQKGLDTVRSCALRQHMRLRHPRVQCHLRLRSSMLSEKLRAYFVEHPTRQQHGYDESGAPANSGAQDGVIHVDILSGTQEKLYWEKIPDSVRLLSLSNSDSEGMKSMSGKKQRFK